MTFERPNIEKMQGYTPGEQPTEGDAIKLNTNENPYPASPAVAAAMASVEIESLRRYPSPMASQFRKAAAALHGVNENNIVPTNGGDELLRLLLTTFVEEGATIATSKPSYSLYSVLAEIHGCKVAEIPLLEDWSMPDDFLAQLKESGACMALLVNPHAPTGSLFSVDYIKRLADGFDGVLVIDEAYIDFVDPTLDHNALPLIESCDNLIFLRSLSKGYSLAGLRFGYGIGAQAIIAPMLYKTRDSYNTDYISQRLATAAIESVDYARQTWEKTRAARGDLAAALAALGITSAPSQTNFLLCQIPEKPGAANLYEALKDRNILVRYFDQDRLRDKLRISIGNEDENAALIAAVSDILSA